MSSSTMTWLPAGSILLLNLRPCERTGIPGIVNNGASQEFATGKEVKDRGCTSMDGLKVQNLTEMKGGTGVAQEQISAAPVAGAES